MTHERGNEHSHSGDPSPPEAQSESGTTPAADANREQVPSEQGAASATSSGASGGTEATAGASGTPPSSPSDGGAPSTILDQLSAQLESATVAAAESEQASQALQADLEELQGAYDDLGKVVEGYARDRASLEQQRKEREAYIEAKRSLIESAIDDRKDEVDQAWTDLNDRLANLEQERAERWNEVVEAQAEHARQQTARDEAKGTFEDLKSRQATIADRLRRLEDLKSGIESAEDTNDPAGMYARLLEYDRELAEVASELKEVEAYRAEFENAWRMLEQAQAGLREATSALARAQNQFDVIKAQLERLAPNRVGEVLRRLAAPGGGGAGEPAAAAAPAPR
jgi:chromosome segregation ATPase